MPPNPSLYKDVVVLAPFANDGSFLERFLQEEAAEQGATPVDALVQNQELTSPPPPDPSTSGAGELSGKLEKKSSGKMEKSALAPKPTVILKKNAGLLLRNKPIVPARARPADEKTDSGAPSRNRSKSAGPDNKSNAYLDAMRQYQAQSCDKGAVTRPLMK